MKPKRCSSVFAAQVVFGAPSAMPGLSAPFWLEQPASRTATRPLKLRRKLMGITGVRLIGHLSGVVRRRQLGERLGRDLNGNRTVEKLLRHGIGLPGARQQARVWVDR